MPIKQMEDGSFLGLFTNYYLTEYIDCVLLCIRS